ncbi:LysM peptidoglycan-binding domain-containing protein [Rhodoferax sp.]|uniref:LysM peptidoglycan-binding domain-containing protein n=1 Tax=Rhodoferax sp. TaxID=50421 RepID=UPI0039B89D95
MACAMVTSTAYALDLTVTPGQKATAEQVAQSGVPLSELAADAPDEYTVKRGDTLWAISGLFLKSPWRWPELWGMNLQDIKNPHRIYPGQKLYLEKKDGRATLRTSPPSASDAAPDTVRVSPRTRFESLADSAVPTLKSNLIEPFLSEPMVVDKDELSTAPRIVATQEGRVLLTRGDRAYARGQGGKPLIDTGGKQQVFRVFHNATALKDPVSGEILGYEAEYAGRALLAQSEATLSTTDKDGKTSAEIVPATIDIISAKEEMQVGDRLVPEPERQLLSYVPRAPSGKVDGRIVSVYGNAVINAGQNQVVAINLGSKHGIESGHVLAILKAGARMVDKTDPAWPNIKLPDERNGLLMVFRTFEKVSYALILDIRDGVRIGDRLVSPR